MARKFALSLIAAAAVATAATSLAAPGTRTGVYTDSQAQAGAELYAVRCAMCHGKMLEGTFETPGLQGKFIANWSNMPLSDLYDYIDRAMPQFAPRTLTPDENAQLVAYLLKSNAMPAGPEPLAANSTALQRVLLEPREIPAAGKGK